MLNYAFLEEPTPSWQIMQAAFSLRILVAGERCNITGEYFERDFISE